MERENVFHIKNMVCNRCILVVTRLLEKAGFTPLDVGLGTAVVQEKPGRERREAFRKLLEAYGFELIDDSRMRLIEQIRIPKLTIVTFVENACVHGIESKASPGWIFVRAYKREEQLCIEIEDTGSGIEEQKLYQMQHDMQNADIEMLKNKKSVGMLNACLRLKMYTEDHVCFEIEGEEGVGTWITICIPMEYLSFAEGCVNGPVCKRGKEIC